MGDPRKIRKKYSSPNNPFERDRIIEELKYLGEYGLRNKKEFRRHKFQLSKYRKLIRKNRAIPEEYRDERFNELRSSLVKLNLVSESAHPDDILSLTIENILERRLQTIVFKNGLAKTIVQARQFTTHGHIAVNGNVIDSPSYLVKKDDEIDFAVNSPFKQDQSKIWGLGKSAKKENVDGEEL